MIHRHKIYQKEKCNAEDNNGHAITALILGILVEAANADDGDDKALELIAKYRADCHVDLSENDKMTVPTDPKTASVEYEFGDDKTVGLSLPAADAHKDMAEKSEGGAAFYGGDSYDMAVMAAEGGFSSYIVIHNETAPTAYEFDVTLPTGFKMSENGAGGVNILNADDGIEGIIAAPWAFDADGEAVTTQFKLNGDTLVQTVEHADAAYPVIADPEYRIFGRNVNLVEARWCSVPTRIRLCRRIDVLSSHVQDHTRFWFDIPADVPIGGDGPANAFLHCYWSARMTIEHGAATARGFGDRHEAYSDADERRMDLGNNAHGRRVGEQAAGATDRHKYRDAATRCYRMVSDGTLQLYE